MAGSKNRLDRSQILTREEMTAIVSGFRACYAHPSQRGPMARQRFTIWRLSACCGLRAIEIASLNVGDLIGLDGDKPAVRIRKSATKGQPHLRRARMVPLWWDRGTLADILDWRDYRVRQIEEWYAAGMREVVDRDPRVPHPGQHQEFFSRVFTGDPEKEPLFCSHKNHGKPTRTGLRPGKGTRLESKRVGAAWKTLVRKFLPADRAKQLGSHAGRHSFITHALYSGVPIADVRDAVGHASLEMTDVYVHALDEVGSRDDIFAYAEPIDGPVHVVDRTRTGQPRIVNVPLPMRAIRAAIKRAKRWGVPENEAVLDCIRVAVDNERLCKTDAAAKWYRNQRAEARRRDNRK